MLEKDNSLFSAELSSQEEKALNDLLKKTSLVNQVRNIFSLENLNSGTHQAYDALFCDDDTKKLFCNLVDLGVGHIDDEEDFIISNKMLLSFQERIECRKSFIKKQTLEKIANNFAELTTATKIIEHLKAWGVPSSLIEYPNTKWRMIFSVFCYYANSPDIDDRNKLAYLIAEIYHPLLTDGNFEIAKERVDEINKFLFFDNFSLEFDNDKKSYYLDYEPTNAELREMHDFSMKQDAKIEANFFQNPEVKDHISVLKKAYQVCINIVEIFCRDPLSVDEDINKSYIVTRQIIYRSQSELRALGNCPADVLFTFSELYFPFSNLFSAESEFNGKEKKLNWDEVRPKMYSSFGNIEDLSRTASSSDVLSEPDTQESLNAISILLSQRKEKNIENEENKREIQTTSKVVNIIKGNKFYGSSPIAMGHTVEQEVENSEKIIILADKVISIFKGEKGISAEKIEEMKSFVNNLEKVKNPEEIKGKFEKIFSFAKEGARQIVWGLVVEFLTRKVGV